MTLFRSMYARLLALTAAAAAVELATSVLILLCLSRPHSPWLWTLVAAGAVSFVGLLKLQFPAPSGVYVFYALLCFAVVLGWFFWVDHLVLTLVDGMAAGAAFLVYLYFRWRCKEEPADDEDS